MEAKLCELWPSDSQELNEQTEGNVGLVLLGKLQIPEGRGGAVTHPSGLQRILEEKVPKWEPADMPTW